MWRSRSRRQRCAPCARRWRWRSHATWCGWSTISGACRVAPAPRRRLMGFASRKVRGTWRAWHGWPTRRAAARARSWKCLDVAHCSWRSARSISHGGCWQRSLRCSVSWPRWSARPNAAPSAIANVGAPARLRVTRQWRYEHSDAPVWSSHPSIQTHE